MARYIDIGRETKDLDFAVRQLSNEIDGLRKIFDEILQIQVDDGVVFKNPTVVPLEHFHMQYPGVHVKAEVGFGKAIFPLFIDLGFGDLIKAHKKEFLLLRNSKGPLFEPLLTINCYPVEFIFAEKLETAIYRGADNSRMKDFHDLYSLASIENMLNGEDTSKAIRLVFEHRRTRLRVPVEFDPSAMEVLQKSWGRYHQAVAAPARLPSQISEVIQVINQFISKGGINCSPS